MVYRDSSNSIPVTNGLANCSTKKDIQQKDMHNRHAQYISESSENHIHPTANEKGI